MTKKHSCLSFCVYIYIYIYIILYLTVYKTHHNFSRANQKIFLVKQSNNIKRDEINIMNIINDKTFNLRPHQLRELTYVLEVNEDYM